MIHLTSGLPGSGKTLLTISKVKERAEKENRPVFYLGIAGVSLPWTEMRDFKDWLSCPKNSLIIIDECQDHLPAQSRGKGVAVPAEVAGFSTHRHRGVDVYLISQDPMQFDHFVRRLVGVQWHCVRPFGMSYCTVWQFEAVQGFNPKEAAQGWYDKITTKTRFDYPTEAFAFYRSAEVHTHKRRLPWKKLLGVAAIVVGIGVAGFAAYKSVGGLGSGSTAAKSKPVPAASSEGSGFSLPGGQQVQHVTALEYVRLRVPRVGGMPESAPVYDGLAAPVTFPRVAACVQGSTRCSCFTQQATVVVVTDEACRNFVRYGAFDPYRSPSPVGGGIVAPAPAQAAPVTPSHPVDSAAPSGSQSAKGGVVGAVAPVSPQPSPKAAPQ